MKSLSSLLFVVVLLFSLWDTLGHILTLKKKNKVLKQSDTVTTIKTEIEVGKRERKGNDGGLSSTSSFPTPRFLSLIFAHPSRDRARLSNCWLAGEPVFLAAHWLDPLSLRISPPAGRRDSDTKSYCVLRSVQSPGGGAACLLGGGFSVCPGCRWCLYGY